MKPIRSTIPTPLPDAASLRFTRWAIRLPSGHLSPSDRESRTVDSPRLYVSRAKARQAARDLYPRGGAKAVRVEIAVGWRVLG